MLRVGTESLGPAGGSLRVVKSAVPGLRLQTTVSSLHSLKPSLDMLMGLLVTAVCLVSHAWPVSSSRLLLCTVARPLEGLQEACARWSKAAAAQALQCLVSTLRSLVDWYTRCQAASGAAEAGPASQGPGEPPPQQDWGNLTSRSTTDLSPTPDAPGTCMPAVCARLLLLLLLLLYVGYLTAAPAAGTDRTACH